MRGKIRNRQYSQQIKDFSELRYEKITPTDIDFGVEFSNKVFIFGELKYGDSQLEIGQKMFLQRTVDALQSSGKVAYLIMARHNIPPDQDIPVGSCIVTRYRHCGEYHTPVDTLTVKELIDQILIDNGMGNRTLSFEEKERLIFAVA